MACECVPRRVGPVAIYAQLVEGHVPPQIALKLVGMPRSADVRVLKYRALLEQRELLLVVEVCIGVEIRQVEEFQQAFLRLSEIVEIPNGIGYSPTPYFQGVDGGDHVLASLADFYEISKVDQVVGIST